MEIMLPDILILQILYSVGKKKNEMDSVDGSVTVHWHMQVLPQT